MDYVWAWLTAFVWTLALELPVYALLLQPRFTAWWATAALTLALNLLTHPLFSWWVLAWDPAEHWVAPVEVAIALTEGLAAGLVLRRRPQAERAFRRGILAAGCANGLSYGVGLLWFGS